MFKLLIGALKWAGAFAIVGGLAWQAASNPIRLDSEVVVHVGVGDVDVLIDGLRFHVDRPLEHPIICQLATGVHELAMLKDGVELYYETFAVEEGEDNVLTAWDENGVLLRDPSASPASAERTAFQSRAKGAAAFAPEPLRRN